MKREDVFELIHYEREYQINKWGDDKNRTIGDFLIYLEKHLSYAKQELYEYNDHGAMEEIRKIGGLAIAAMEKFKTPSR